MTNFGGVAPNVSIIGLNFVQSFVEIRCELLIESAAKEFKEVREISQFYNLNLLCSGVESEEHFD